MAEPSTLKFKDINFKLMVINVLMYEKNILKPKFDRKKFATSHGIDSWEEIDMLEVPAVLNYFEGLEISAADLAKVEEINQDGGDSIYMELAPADWGGEDDRYCVRSAQDLTLLPNLKKITLLQPFDENLVEKLNAEFQPFEEKGLDANWG
jgi:hypothetical protein